MKFAGWQITERIAESIFIALSSDTGWFKFGNADSRIFHTAAELIRRRGQTQRNLSPVVSIFTPARIYLMGRMLEHLQLHADGRIATQYILRKDFDETGSTGADTENLIDECQRIQTVQVAALFVELSDGGFRCSLRSKGDVDVRKIAQKYGGGGHTLAAGVNLAGPLEKALRTIVDEITAQLEGFTMKLESIINRANNITMVLFVFKGRFFLMRMLLLTAALALVGIGILTIYAVGHPSPIQSDPVTGDADSH